MRLASHYTPPVASPQHGSSRSRKTATRPLAPLIGAPQPALITVISLIWSLGSGKRSTRPDRDREVAFGS